MGTRFRFLPGIVVPVLLLGLSACSNGSSSSSAGTGAVFVASQGDSTVTSFSIDLSTGLLTANGGSIAAGRVPSAMILAPSGTALFIANSNPSITPTVPPTPCTLPSPGTITAYNVKTDGTLTAGSGSTQAGFIPVAMAIDGGGHFLFVANQGLQCIPDSGPTSGINSGTVSVFAIQDKTLTEVPGSPFVVAEPGAPGGTGPSGVAVTPDGKFLYVSNQFDSTVSKFSVDATGVLTRGPVLAVGTTPATLAMTANGGFLYVGNASTISGFAICGQVLTSCGDPTSPDGSLTAVEGSPFPSGIDPVAIVSDPSGKFLFAVNRQSNQISQYRVATGSGVLTANTQAVISTGATPVGATIRVGTTTNKTTGGVTDYMYVPNLGSSSISVYSFDSTVGLLGLVGSPVSITGGQPGAVAAE